MRIQKDFLYAVNYSFFSQSTATETGYNLQVDISLSIEKKRCVSVNSSIKFRITPESLNNLDIIHTLRCVNLNSVYSEDYNALSNINLFCPVKYVSTIPNIYSVHFTKLCT